MTTFYGYNVGLVLPDHLWLDSRKLWLINFWFWIKHFVQLNVTKSWKQFTLNRLFMKVKLSEGHFQPNQPTLPIE